jgi:hypothetical protein
MPGLRLQKVVAPPAFPHDYREIVRVADLDFPRTFTGYYNRGPGREIEYELEIEFLDGSPRCVAIRNPAGITPLRGLREDLGNLDELVKQAVSIAPVQAGDKELRPLRRSDLRRARQAVKRRRYGDDYHRQVLDLAAEAKARGERQDYWVGDELGLAYATARTHIRRARDALGEH